MNENTVGAAIKSAINEAKTPPGLLERTAQAARAVDAGREAEKRLASSEARSEKDTVSLAAAAMVGRMARVIIPPKGATAENMASQLAESKRFSDEVVKNSDRLLRIIDDGTLLKLVTAKTPQRDGCNNPDAVPKAEPENGKVL